MALRTGNQDLVCSAEILWNNCPSAKTRSALSGQSAQGAWQHHPWQGRADRLALACLLARGHLLIEDLPGLGKTMLAQALARVLGLSFRRIQFTSDLLPADIVGVSVFRQNKGEFEFQPGPIFSQLILADEVNRATPKAQSALLEAMEEYQVSVDGNTRRCPNRFSSSQRRTRRSDRYVPSAGVAT